MKPRHGDTLLRKAEGAITALLNQGTLVTAAATAGVSVRTLKRWPREPMSAVAYPRGPFSRPPIAGALAIVDL